MTFPLAAFPAATPVLAVTGVEKTFTMHLRDGQRLPVLRGLTFVVHAGECVALGGPSGTGKSSILKMVYGNYAVDHGSILLRPPGTDERPYGGAGASGGEPAADAVDIAAASPRQVLGARRDVMGYVSQFLHCVPRVGALQVVAEPLVERGVPVARARERAARLLTELAIPERLWSLPPATFSGGEQQRVNIARGFAAPLPLLLLDEPTASLDARNRDVVTELILRRRAQGTAILGIFHDEAVREAVADRVLDVERFAPVVGAAA